MDETANFADHDEQVDILASRCAVLSFGLEILMVLNSTSFKTVAGAQYEYEYS
jgi:hypothetical protein